MKKFVKLSGAFCVVISLFVGSLVGAADEPLKAGEQMASFTPVEVKQIASIGFPEQAVDKANIAFRLPAPGTPTYSVMEKLMPHVDALGKLSLHKLAEVFVMPGVLTESDLAWFQQHISYTDVANLLVLSMLLDFTKMNGSDLCVLPRADGSLGITYSFNGDEPRARSVEMLHGFLPMLAKNTFLSEERFNTLKAKLGEDSETFQKLSHNWGIVARFLSKPEINIIGEYANLYSALGYLRFGKPLGYLPDYADKNPDGAIGFMVGDICVPFYTTNFMGDGANNPCSFVGNSVFLLPPKLLVALQQRQYWPTLPDAVGLIPNVYKDAVNAAHGEDRPDPTVGQLAEIFTQLGINFEIIQPKKD